jgi:hypothetical protein
LEHGVTFAGPGDGAFALNAGVSGVTKDAEVRGYQMLLRSPIAYSAISRAAAKGPQAFESASKYLVANMVRSLSKKLEIEMFYGQVGYGTVASVSGATVTITTGEFAPGIWSGAENMPIEIRNAAGTTKRGEATVASVDLAARTITLDSAIAGVVSTDVIWHKGAYGNEFAGVHKIVSNTTAEIFGISAASYNLWAGNSYSAGSATLSFGTIQKAIAKAIPKGLESDVKVFINPSAWANLLTDQAALREYDTSYSTEVMKNGAKKLVFQGQNGLIEIVTSIYVKESYAYVLSLDEFVRVGSTDITFNLPGQDKFFRQLENNAGLELRAYTDQALFCFAPGRQVLITSIVNS